MLRDEACLLDILVAARKARAFCESLTKERFLQDDLAQNAVMRLLTIMGEAARKVSEEFKAAHPEIEWRRFVVLRNRLVHEYFRIDLDEVWVVVEDDLAPLMEQISPLVPPEDAV
jgi:uncharacterized protein with HEPN domain